MLWCSYKVEGDEQTATAELRGLRVVTQINLGSAEPSAPTSEVCLNHTQKSIITKIVNSSTYGNVTAECVGTVSQCRLKDFKLLSCFWHICCMFTSDFMDMCDDNAG